MACLAVTWNGFQASGFRFQKAAAGTGAGASCDFLCRIDFGPDGVARHNAFADGVVLCDWIVRRFQRRTRAFGGESDLNGDSVVKARVSEEGRGQKSMW